MKVLVIGNGFDLAHDLKTRYEDFIHNALRNAGYKLETPNYTTLFKEIRRESYYGITSLHHYDCYDQSKKLNSNQLDKLFRLTDNWIDVESNLASILENISRNEHDFLVLEELFNEFLLPGFENYIATNINQCKAEPIFGYSCFIDYDFVISFNHSRTLERLYELTVPVCYINGEAQENAPEPNIVLGCDFFREGRENEKYTWFNKECQRAYKKTDRSFKRLYDDDSQELSITIIGHSLGKTDHNILKPFIVDLESTVNVYYHNDDSHRSLIHNMRVLGGQGFLDKGNVDFKDI